MRLIRTIVAVARITQSTGANEIVGRVYILSNGTGGIQALDLLLSEIDGGARIVE
jgi:hypothetical protein